MISPEMLRHFSFFAGAKEESLKRIAMIAEERSFSAGQILFHEGEPANTLFLLSEGEVDIQTGHAGTERITVDTLVKNDLLAWSALVEPHQTRFWGVARTDASVIAINAPELRELFEADPKLGYYVMKGVSEALSHRLAGARVQLAAH